MARPRRLIQKGVTNYNNTEFILHARVPIVTFVDSRWRVETDICLGGDGTPFKAWFVQQVSKMSPAFCDLFRLVRRGRGMRW